VKDRISTRPISGPDRTEDIGLTLNEIRIGREGQHYVDMAEASNRLGITKDELHGVEFGFRTLLLDGRPMTIAEFASVLRPKQSG